MNLYFIRFLSDKDMIKEDFWISRYPVTTKEFRKVMADKDAGPVHQRIKQRASWTEAVRYCNALNRMFGLPLSYDENSGLLIDENQHAVEPEWDGQKAATPVHRVRGYRLPCFEEWECAAKGRYPKFKCSCYYPILENTFKFYDQNSDVYLYGKSDLETMEVNTAGLFGMLGNAHEWYSDNNELCAAIHRPNEIEIKNKLCYWEEY